MIEASKIRVKQTTDTALSTHWVLTNGYDRRPGSRKRTNVLQSLRGRHAQIDCFYALSFLICTNNLRHKMIEQKL